MKHYQSVGAIASQVVAQNRLVIGSFALLILLFLPFTSVLAKSASLGHQHPTVIETALLDELGVQAILRDYYQQGLLAFQSGDREGAIELWRTAGDQGHIESQYNLGLVYSQGYGVAKNAAVAAKWWNKAAENGNPAAQFNLGLMYAEGQGVDQNLQLAVAWWRKSANQGFEHAIRALEVLRMHDALFNESEQLRQQLSSGQQK